VEVGHVEQFRLSVLDPLSPCETLAFWTVAIPARVVRHTLMAAIVAPLDVPAESAVRQRSIAITARRRAVDNDASC
jgi:hypothetical protein